MSGSDVFRQELAGLRETVEGARSMPMSASVMVNGQELLDALDRLEAAFVEVTSDSAGLLARRDAVVAEGEASAAEIVRQARLEQERLVSDTEVFRLARRASDEMAAASRLEADSLRAETEAYVEQRLAGFEHALERTLTEVRRGIANLTGRSAFDDPGDVLPAEPQAG